MKLRARDLYWGISDFKKSYRPRNNIAKDDKGDLLIECHSILARWRKHFSQLLNVNGTNDVRQTEIHTIESLVPEPSAFETEMAIEKLKRPESPGIDQIPAELINPLNPELNPMCCLLALLGAHHFLRVSRIRVKLLTFRRLMSYIWSTYS